MNISTNGWLVHDMKTPLKIESVAIKEFYERRDRFWKSVSNEEKRVVAMVDQLLSEIPPSISTMTGPEPILDQETRLSVLLDTLGEFMAKSETEYLAVKDFLEEKYAEEFMPTKTALEQERGKILKAEIETRIERKYREERWLMRLLEERYKIYKAKYFSGDRLLDAIKNRIIHLRRSEQQANVQARISNNQRYGSQ